MSNEMIERVAKAIEIASQYRPYGLYDYSRYPGDTAPHVVKDEIADRRVFASNDKEKAYEVWKKLTQGYVAKAAIAAMRDLVKCNPDGNAADDRIVNEYIDAVLKE